MRAPSTVLLLSAVIATHMACSSACGEEHGPDAAVDAGSVPLPNLDASASRADSGGAALLPAGLKGYELYAWEENGLLRFMLISGTNRLKTLDELRVEDSAVERDDGWVAISGTGLDRLSALLERVPAESSVLLQRFEGLPELPAEQRARVEALLAQRKR